MIILGSMYCISLKKYVLTKNYGSIADNTFMENLLFTKIEF